MYEVPEALLLWEKKEYETLKKKKSIYRDSRQWLLEVDNWQTAARWWTDSDCSVGTGSSLSFESIQNPFLDHSVPLTPIGLTNLSLTVAPGRGYWKTCYGGQKQKEQKRDNLRHQLKDGQMEKESH